MEEEKKEVLEETPKTETDSDAPQEKERKAKPLNKKFILALIVIIIFALLYTDYKKEISTQTQGNSSGASSTAEGWGAPAKANESFLDYLKGKVGSITGNKKTAGLSMQEAEDFINQNLMQDGTGAKVSEVTEESGLYKITGKVEDQDFILYLTKDKAKFSVDVRDIAEIQKQKADAQNKQKEEEEKQLAEMVKNDKPVVELFVMSHCPYGTQMEKGIIPVVKALGDKIDFKLKFCDYAMHNDAATNNTKELTEEMNQYCISQNQPDKLIPYLECFLADETSSSKCVAQVGIDSAKLNSCVAATDSKYKITAGFKDQSTWKDGTYPLFPIFKEDVEKYKVGGSPTLVINGKTINSGRDSAKLLQFVCAAFNNAPEECKQSLSSTAPAPGFGYAEGSGSTSSGTCG